MVTLVAAGLCLVPLVHGMLALRGTTARAPGAWSFAAVSAPAAVALVVAWREGSSAEWLPHLKYAAAITTFAPGIAILGAKRPQAGAWQFIVVAAVAILAMPAWLAWSRRAGTVSPHPAWIVFAALVWLTCLANHLFTRYWPASLCVAFAQLALVADALGWPPGDSPGRLAPWAFSIAAAGAWLVEATALRGPPGADSFDRMWRAFRDLYGALWALRVAERFRLEAAKDDLRVGLDLAGWHSVDDQGHFQPRASGASAPPGARRLLESLLSRFVSPAWLARHAGDAR